MIDNFKDKNVCVMGLGYVGLTLATVMAEVGFRIRGVEIKDEILARLQQGEPHFFEPGMAPRLKKVFHDGRITFSKNIPAGSLSTVYIITVGTPLDPYGKVRMDMIENVAQEVAQALKDGDLVIMRSTVKIGTTRNFVLPILQKSQVKFDLAFCPERTLEGQALSELRYLPQIVAGDTPAAAVRAAQLFQFLTPTVVRVSDAETAEMIKLMDNSSRDVNFAFANEVARICSAVGIDASEVIKAGKLGYARTNIAWPGPVGGPCLEKDPYILAEGLQLYGIQPELIITARRLNERQPEEVISYLANILKSQPGFPERPIISLLGLAFKGRPATDDLRGTMARPIYTMAQHYFPQAEFRGYDPVVKLEQIRDFGLAPCPTLEQAMQGASLVLIMNNHPVFSEMIIENLAILMARPGLVYDFWNNFVAQDLDLPEGTGYMSLGSHKKAVLPCLFSKNIWPKNI